MKYPKCDDVEEVREYVLSLLRDKAPIRVCAKACLQKFDYKPSSTLIAKWRDEAGIDVKPRYADKTEAAKISRFNKLMKLMDKKI